MYVIQSYVICQLLCKCHNYFMCLVVLDTEDTHSKSDEKFLV